LDEVNVTFKTSSNDKNIPIQKGEILRSAMLKRGISPHNGRSRLINCRGLGTCGTCAVEVVPDESDDAIEPKERNTKERLRLKFPPHGSSDQSSNLRLACQIQVNGDVSVKKRTGFWGQDTGDLAEEFESELWFGDLEYIMDDKSPSQKAD
jgi:ferredoxin